MERRRHLAQELTDHIIDFLHDSPGDWPACALVCRSWVYAAQAHIFRSVYLLWPERDPNERRWARFLELSAKSPDLIRHVRQLAVTIVGKRMSTDTFLAICTFPFTRLDGVWLILTHPTPPEILAVQQLLSRPTLRRARIVCIEPSGFFQIWDRCSAALAHVQVAYYTRSAERFCPSQSSSLPIRLQTLDLNTTVGEGLIDWDQHRLTAVPKVRACP
ncbi:hypothetical protein C8R44DRAFT_251125 [Mycena epipterygia]|nr:hypothetical protein C8R44DRAFT_251125 [Mycena epipterygia]